MTMKKRSRRGDIVVLVLVFVVVLVLDCCSQMLCNRGNNSSIAAQVCFGAALSFGSTFLRRFLGVCVFLAVFWVFVFGLK